MSEELNKFFDVFDAIDKDSSDGIVPMLNKIAEVKSEDGDYSTVAEVNYHLKMIELGIPKDAERKDIPEEKWVQLEEAEREFRAEAGEMYTGDERYRKAAFEYLRAGNWEEALQMYILDGSLESINSAESLAIDLKNYELALDLRIERGQVGRAFDIWKHMPSRENLEKDDMQELRERIIRHAYSPVVEIIKAQFEPTEIPEGETITELLANVRMGVFFYGSDVNRYIEESIKCAMDSNIPEIIEIGIESNGIRTQEAEEYRNDYIEKTEMFLLGKLTGDKQYTQYFIEHAEEKQKEGKCDMAESYARWAIKLLRYQEKCDDALEVAEKYLSPINSQRIELLEKFGDLSNPDNQGLVTDHYRMGNNPIKYAFALAKAGKSA